MQSLAQLQALPASPAALRHTQTRLDIAQAYLLEPFALDRRELTNALALMAKRGVDDADLYFQYTRSEGWSLEEGIVKSGFFGID